MPAETAGDVAPNPTAPLATRTRPKLAAFHRDPPRQLNIRLDATDHERLEEYTRFYNETLGAEVAPADVAAQIVSQWLDKDRAFRRWREKA
jgi:hypothetical protein